MSSEIAEDEDKDVVVFALESSFSSSWIDDVQYFRDCNRDRLAGQREVDICDGVPRLPLLRNEDEDGNVVKSLKTRVCLIKTMSTMM